VLLLLVSLLHLLLLSLLALLTLALLRPRCPTPSCCLTLPLLLLLVLCP